MNLQRQTGLVVMPRYHGTKRPRTRYHSRWSQPCCPVCGANAKAARIGQWAWLGSFLIALARKRYHRKEGGKSCMGRAEDHATKLVKLPERIAAIVGKTLAYKADTWDPDKGDLADDEAFIFIQDLLEEFDPEIMGRNKNKRLIRR